jgi:rhamnulokinase
MTEKIFLIADFGASNGRLLHAGFNGERFSLGEIHRFENRPVTAGGTLYWDFLRLFSEIKIGLGKAFHHLKGDIVSLAVDTWGVDFGLLDKHNRLLSNPVHYRDGRRHSVKDELFALITKEELFSVSGYAQATIMSIFQLFAMNMDKEPVLDAADSFLLMPDLFAYFLTGEKYNEATIADTSLLYNIFSRSWDLKTVNQLKLPDHIFQPIIYPGETIGKLSRDVADKTGGGMIPVIAPASHDTASAVAGIPLINDDTPWGFISLGTWAVFGTATEEPVMDFSILEAGYGNEFTIDGTNFFARNITALWIIQQCKYFWETEKESPITWEEIISGAETARSFQSFIDVDHPDFAQMQDDMPEIVRSYCEKTMQRIPADRAEISRCIFESLVMKFKHCLYETERYSKTIIGRIHMIGGGSKNHFICRETAEALGIPVYAGPEEATAIGNLLAQMQGTGTISSLEEGHEIIRRSNTMVAYEPSRERDAWEKAYERYIHIKGENT